MTQLEELMQGLTPPIEERERRNRAWRELNHARAILRRHTCIYDPIHGRAVAVVRHMEDKVYGAREAARMREAEYLYNI